MPPCRIDHLVVTAPSLQSGAEFIRQRLGVEPQPGGRHPRMGTHNLLLRLGEALYLEVISSDPSATAPARARWFGLDHLHPDAEPALQAWVARTPDIRTSVVAATEELGDIEPMSRGELRWLITIPNDGVVPLQGSGPALIEWESAVHPAAGLRDFGLALVEFTITHPDPDRVSRLLSSIDMEDQIAVSAPAGRTASALSARINTPQGPRRL